MYMYTYTYSCIHTDKWTSYSLGKIQNIGDSEYVHVIYNLYITYCASLRLCT